MIQQSRSRSDSLGLWKTVRVLALAGFLLSVGALGAQQSMPSVQSVESSNE
jgi:hypothetical protein